MREKGETKVKVIGEVGARPPCLGGSARVCYVTFFFCASLVCERKGYVSFFSLSLYIYIIFVFIFETIHISI
jgi:hypothetical protein